MANELTITKEQTAKFVHDAVEMETAVFTLDRAIAECEKKKEENLQSARNNLQSAQANHARCKEKVDNPPKMEENSKSSIATIGAGGLGCLGTIVLFSTIYNPIYAWINSFLNLHIFSLIISVVITLLILFIPYTILVVVGVIIDDKRDKPLKDAYQAELAKLAREEKQAKMYVNNREIDLRKALSQASLLTTQISDLRTKRNQVQSTLSRFYDLGVIPPDYRYMDCAIMLDQIFRNDLADTMRDAIKIYEERVFRGEVIKGMDRICSMLGNLSAGMMAIEQRLSFIDSNVKMMSQDLYNFSERIAQGQAKQQKATEDLLKETEMSRYAAERVAESAKNLEWHERRRQGWV